MYKKKVVVLDDEPHIVTLIKLSLRHKFEVFETFTSEELMEVIQKEKPDVVLLDIMMPGEDGYSVCARIREENDKLPIIFISAKSHIDDKMKSIDVGGDDYITKPFNPLELEMKIEEILKQ